MPSDLAPVYLDDTRVTLQGDPRPQVSKILQASGRASQADVVVLRLQEAAGAAGQPVGLDEQGRMGLFDDPSIAAWYQWGPAPASPAGSTVIAAHVDSLEYDLLPFARLKDARASTQIFVTDAAGTRHPYVVQSLQVIEKADVDWVAAFDRAGPPRLTLVTCGGEFDYENRRYLSNLVLTAIHAG